MDIINGIVKVYKYRYDLQAHHFYAHTIQRMIPNSLKDCHRDPLIMRKIIGLQHSTVLCFFTVEVMPHPFRLEPRHLKTERHFFLMGAKYGSPTGALQTSSLYLPKQKSL